MNYLEQLISEWYKYQGYFVVENLRVGRRELDVVAYHLADNKLVHIEASTDYPYRRSTTDKIYRRKFNIDRKHFQSVFGVHALPTTDKIAVFLSVQNRIKKGDKIGGALIISVAGLLKDIKEGLKGKNLKNGIVHENLPIIRTMQIVFENYQGSVGINTNGKARNKN